MRKNRNLLLGLLFIGLFILWTILIQTVDVKPIGVNDTNIGLSTMNVSFHKWIGSNMFLYIITDWLGLVPVFLCLVFGVLGFVQLIQRRSIVKVDKDLIVLGFYYVLVIGSYLLFEMIPINYRPILIDGRMEASYPSSTTLLVLSVMPTLIFQVNQRLENPVFRKIICISTSIFSAFMVIGRLVSGVHWFTDIVGSIMLSAGMFCIYKAFVLLSYKEDN